MINLTNKVIALIFLMIISVQFCIAEEELERVDLLKQQIISSKSIDELDPLFVELMDIYAQDNRFNEFYNFLETLAKDKKFKKSPLTYYYKTLARFRQMQFLEENKMWDDFFDKKDLYIADLDKALVQAKKLISSVDPLVLRLKFLEWQIKKNDEQARIYILEDLFNLAREYTQTKGDIHVIRDIADGLSQEKETNYAKKLYNVYLTKITEMDISEEELKALAEGFLEEVKVNLAINLYDAYLERITKTQQNKDIIIKEMFDIAEKFAHPGWQDGLDPFFAEKVYEKIESVYKSESFDAVSQHRRAYNLERIKEYESCVAEYIKLVNNFPDYTERDRIYFRLAILTAYIFGKMDQAREYFLKVVNDFPQSQDYLNSLYHLGLLAQWCSDSKKAMEFYNLILEKTKDIGIKPEIVSLAESRVKEIQENKDIEYNLRMFLEAVLGKKEERPYLELELVAKEPKEYLNETIRFEISSYFTDTGCLQQDFTYLWSGQLGSNQNPFNENGFETSYDDLGTKVVNVVLIDLSGIVGGTIEIVDIYAKK